MQTVRIGPAEPAVLRIRPADQVSETAVWRVAGGADAAAAGLGLRPERIRFRRKGVTAGRGEGIISARRTVFDH